MKQIKPFSFIKDRTNNIGIPNVVLLFELKLWFYPCYSTYVEEYVIFFIVDVCSFIIFILNVVLLTNTEAFVSCRNFVPKMFYKNEYKKTSKTYK